MKSFEHIAAPHPVANRIQPWMAVSPGSPGLLRLVTSGEVEALQAALDRGTLPTDFETKLRRLAGGNLVHRFLEQQCRLFVALLLASRGGPFTQATPAECQRLLLVLAYVRKDDDAIPDYKPGGYADDLQEVRAAATELDGVLQAFKAWRLRHQVPAMWLS